MSKKPILVDLEKLRAITTGLDLGDQKLNEYIEACWLNYVEWWDSRASNAKWKNQGRMARMTAVQRDARKRVPLKNPIRMTSPASASRP